MTKKFLNKVNKDKIYKNLLSILKTENEFLNAGFFEDNLETQIKHNKGLNSYLMPYIPEKTDAIIIQTGSFAPYHYGHFQNLLLSKTHLNSLNFKNIHALICPDHDEYVIRKVDDKNFHIHNRISFIQKKFKKDWISIDNWMGIAMNTSVNFTEQILHIKENLKSQIPIFYLCGGDNANFWKTFLLEGYCLIISRGKEDKNFEKEKLQFEKLCLENSDLKNRIFWIYGNCKESSTSVRKNFQFDELKKKVIIRTNGSEIELKIIENLKKYFDEISILNINDQKHLVKNYLENHINLISLDSEIPLKYNIRVSRKFEPFGISKLNFFIDESKTNLPEDKQQMWYLFDDDSYCSYNILNKKHIYGKTLNFVDNYLENLGYKISLDYKVLVLSDEKTEVLDVRDFLIEFDNSGLLVELSNGLITRIPYIFPLISTFERCSILDLNFSKEIIDLNIEYWKNYQTEFPRFQNNLWNFLGYKNLTNYEICLKLKNFYENNKIT